MIRLSSIGKGLAGFVFGIGVAAVNAQSVQQVKPGSELSKTEPRQGWFFYQEPVEEKKKPEVRSAVKKPEVTVIADEPTVIISSTKPPQDEKKQGDAIVISREEQCGTPSTWTADCGFVDPGDNFEFQATQRDILLQQMSLKPYDPQAVEAAQRYMKWVIGKASEAANMWYFNLVQKPDLDPTVQSPISEVGLALATKIENATQNEYFNLIREEGGVLFYFTRADCSYCHDQAPYTRRVAHTMGLQVVNVPLDGKCLEGFTDDNCGNNITTEQIAPLNVSVVPSLYLYVPTTTWIRLGTGMTTDATILANTVNFFSAYRAALLSGIDNGDGVRPSVTFNPDLRGVATGVSSADGTQAAALPDKSKVLEMMGYRKK